MKRELKILAILLGAFFLAFFMPWNTLRVRQAGLEAFLMLQDYAREHVIFCLVPAFFIAGAIGVFVSQQSVVCLRYARARCFLSLRASTPGVPGSARPAVSCIPAPQSTCWR